MTSKIALAERLQEVQRSQTLQALEELGSGCSNADVNAYFKRLKKIGKGGHATVWKAQVLKLARQELPPFMRGGIAHDVKYVAIKTINPKGNKEMLKMYFQEFDVMRQVSSNTAYSLKYYGCFGDENTIHVVMELCEGADLTDWLEDYGTLENKITIVKFIALAIQELHSKHIIHGDIKPGNIMICNADLKLVDYGFARNTENPRHVQYATGGTPRYTPRRRIKTKEGLIYIDWWALGQIAADIFIEDRDGELAVTYDELISNGVPAGMARVISKLTDPSQHLSSEEIVAIVSS